MSISCRRISGVLTLVLPALLALGCASETSSEEEDNAATTNIAQGLTGVVVYAWTPIPPWGSWVHGRGQVNLSPGTHASTLRVCVQAQVGGGWQTVLASCRTHYFPASGLVYESNSIDGCDLPSSITSDLVRSAVTVTTASGLETKYSSTVYMDTHCW